MLVACVSIVWSWVVFYIMACRIGRVLSMRSYIMLRSCFHYYYLLSYTGATGKGASVEVACGVKVCLQSNVLIMQSWSLISSVSFRSGCVVEVGVCR